MKKMQEFGGLALICENLEKIKRVASFHYHHTIDQNLLYASMLFEVTMNVESDYIIYKESALESIRIFDEVYKKTLCPTAKFMVDLHTSALEYVSKLVLFTSS